MSFSALVELDGQMLDGLSFCSKVYAIFEAIRAEEGGQSRLRRRSTRVEKRLLEELLPIAKYVQLSYRLGRYIRVRWVDGNQSYDAELEQEGSYVSQNFYPAEAFLEVVGAVHPKEHLSRELLDTNGTAFGLEGIRRLKSGEIESVPVGYSNRDFVTKFAAILLAVLEKKAAKKYPPNTSLVVQATLNMPYVPDEWDDLIAQVSERLPPSGFREIFVYDSLHSHSHIFYPANVAPNNSLQADRER